ncbi:glutamine amidotransferase [Roseimaritima sediminicola]|uniref:glutamine amidotransferase n=1 Tax=Roseimaritima sediminicola TaxID=2662066 RepID=UPI0012984DB8|nr:glutamine amidotransferase [Roseimaritima sediminicola]
MIIATIKLGAPEWFVPSILVLVVATAVITIGYWHRTLPLWMKLVGGGLKLVAIAALAFCLLEPMRQGERPRPQANLVPIVVDESESMLVGASNRDTAAAQLHAMLKDEQPWRVRLEQDFAVRSHAFAAKLHGVESFDALDFTGTATALGDALDTVAARYRNRPVAGVLLVTDGNTSDGGDPSRRWRELGVPVYPVLLERPPLGDVRIESTTISQSDFEAAPVTLDVRLAAEGLAGQACVVALLDGKNERVDERDVEAPADGEGLDVRFRFRPERSGVQFYTVACYLKSEADSFEEGTSRQEATLANNRRVVAVDRPRGPFRILYIAGRPNWEFKFLRRSLAADAEVELTGLLRIAKRQPKFNFRDSSLGDTNPLFAGVGGTEEETAEESDEPVILRLGVEQAEQLRGGFPADAAELFAYDAVILDDVEAEFFTTDQQLLLRRFVAARGGGLMMLGGQESFAKGDYDQTPIGEMLPVYLRQTTADTTLRSADASEPRLYRYRLTRAGMLQPWLRLRTNEVEERFRLQQAVPLHVLNRAPAIKPAAEILATVTPEVAPEDALPAVVAQRFGSGRTAAVLVGDLWRWFMRPQPAGEAAPGNLLASAGLLPGESAEEPAQQWRQWVRWLISDVPRRVEIHTPDDVSNHRPQTLNVLVRDESFLPLDNAAVELQITTPAGEQLTIPASQDQEQAGRYQATYWSPESGGFAVQAVVRDEDGSLLGETETGWALDRAAAEYRQLEINQPLLQRIADETGGQVIHPDHLDEFVAGLSTRKMPVMETWTYPLWHRPWMLLLALACLCTEWGLRRWKGWP